MKSFPAFSSILLLLLRVAPVAGDAFEDLWNSYVQATETKKYESTVSRRERNLDHWDVPAAAAYLGLHPETLAPLPVRVSESSPSGADAAELGAAASPRLADEYAGHDAAVLFYAQWCRNCHAVAPSWDAIATHLNAGSRSSNLIMALFDCEKNTRHAELCLAAGIKAYPTLMFVGSGEFHDTDPITSSILGEDKSAGPFGASPLRRTAKFQGNWQYADQILDWVNVMRGLSSWHSMSESGPLRFFRNGMFNFITGGKASKYGKGNKGKEESLPVGVPPGFQAELRGAGATTASAQEVKDLETKLNTTVQEKELYERAVTHSGYLLESVLFPPAEGDSSAPKDPFSILGKSEAWFQNVTTLPPGSPNSEHPSVVRSCVIELALDYCTRVTTRATNAYLEELGAIPESDPFPSMAEIEARLLSDVNEVEPYCGLVESCILGNFEDEGCRPAMCPFRNEAACHYLMSCMDPNVQDEYGVALGLIERGEKLAEKDLGSKASVGSGKEEKQGDGGCWEGWRRSGGMGYPCDMISTVL